MKPKTEAEEGAGLVYAGCGLQIFLTILFVVAKMAENYINTPLAHKSWWWAFSPLWFPFAVPVVGIGLICALALVVIVVGFAIIGVYEFVEWVRRAS